MIKNRIFNGVATVYIDGEIGVDVNGGNVAREIMDLKSMGYDVVVNINSVGGSVIEGYQIIDAIIQTQANTHVSGMAASMAGIIAMFGMERTANDFAMFMIHPVRGGDDQLRDMIIQKFKGILKANTKFDETLINEMMDGKKDYWYDAEEAYSYGLINKEPINTGMRKIPIEFSNDLSEAYNFVNKLNFSINMKDVINKLNLSTTASETDIVNKIDSMIEAENGLKTDLQNKVSELETLKNEVEELKTKVNAQAEKSAEVLINSAIQEGKITKESKNDWIEKAKADYSGAESLLNSIAIKHGNTHAIDIQNTTDTSEKPEKILNDPDKVKEFVRNEFKMQELKDNSPEVFEQMINAYSKI